MALQISKSLQLPFQINDQVHIIPRAFSLFSSMLEDGPLVLSYKDSCKMVSITRRQA
jgi:hypothetical protein